MKRGSLPAWLEAAGRDRPLRACLSLPVGTSRLEVEWASTRHILLAWMYMGSVGCAFRHAIFWHVRGTFSRRPRPSVVGQHLVGHLPRSAHRSSPARPCSRPSSSGLPHGSFRNVEDAVGEWTASSDHHYALFQHMYPRNVWDSDTGSIPEACWSDAHMAETWRDSRHQACFWRRGMSQKLNRWFQFFVRSWRHACTLPSTTGGAAVFARRPCVCSGATQRARGSAAHRQVDQRTNHEAPQQLEGCFHLATSVLPIRKTRRSWLRQSHTHSMHNIPQSTVN